MTKGGRSPRSTAKFSYAQMMRDVLVASISKGQFPVATVTLIAIVVIVKMPSEDLSKLIFLVVDRLEHGQLVGYLLALVFAIGWMFHARFQRRLIDEEMQRMSRHEASLQVDKRIESSEGHS